MKASGSLQISQAVTATKPLVQAGSDGLAILKIVEDSAAHYDATGLHISLDEFKSWIDAIKLNTSAGLPLCHT